MNFIGTRAVVFEKTKNCKFFGTGLLVLTVLTVFSGNCNIDGNSDNSNGNSDSCTYGSDNKWFIKSLVIDL